MSLTPAIRPYISNSYYHIFNRGAHHDAVFRDDKDFWIFRNIVRKVLLESGNSAYLRCFSLLPNHFHLLLYQNEAWTISKIMKSIGIRYAKIFNKKYNLSGQIFESAYQCKHLPTEQDVLRVERYILNNPINAGYINWKHVGKKI